MVRGLTDEIRESAFRNEPVVVIGTGGFSRLFDREHLFDAVLPELVLVGLDRALALNAEGSRPWSDSD
jgi:type III pantothenate kinase